MEAPTPFNILLWRSVVDRGDELWVGYRTVLESRDTPVRWTIYPRGAEALAGMEDMREVKTLKWFSDGWWIARRHVKGAWVGDLRFGESRAWGDKKGMVDSRPAFAWNVLPGCRWRAPAHASSGTRRSRRERCGAWAIASSAIATSGRPSRGWRE